MKLYEKLVHLRKEKGITQLELAEAVKVSRQAVSKWEVGGAMPSMENLLALSELYGVSVEALLTDDIALPRKERENRTVQQRSQGRKAKFIIAFLLVLVIFLFVTIVVININFHGLCIDAVSYIDVYVPEPNGVDMYTKTFIFGLSPTIFD